MSVASAGRKSANIVGLLSLGIVYVMALTLLTVGHWARAGLSYLRTPFSGRFGGQHDETLPGTERNDRSSR